MMGTLVLCPSYFLINLLAPCECGKGTEPYLWLMGNFSHVGRREPKANPGVIGMVDSYLVQVQAWALKGGNV